MKFGNPTTVIACIRVSGKEQELSPEAQQTAMEQYCQTHGLTMVATFLERVTSVAPLEERLGLLDALQALRAHDAGILLFFDRDRISRDVLLTKLIEREALKAGAVVATVTGTNGTTAHDEMMKTVLDAFAQLERARIIDRTRKALQVKKSRGEYVGGLPYGYRWQDGALVPHPEEQQVIRDMQALRADGASFNVIARTVPHLTRKGTKFTKTQVIRILT